MFFSKYFSAVLAFASLIFFSGALVAIAANTMDIPYTPLAPLPLGKDGALLDTYTISTYLSGMFKLIIALGAAFAVLMGITGGIQYVASGIAPAARKGAKERITNAVIGLVIILTSYLILNTIDPKLVAFNFELLPIEGTRAVVAPEVVGKSIFMQTSNECPNVCDPGYSCMSFTTIAGTTPACQPLKIPGCSDCVPLGTSISTKGYGTACAKNETGACYVDEDLKPKLEKLNTALTKEKINWWVTEAYPPTRKHQAACQQVGTSSSGTCIDANFLNSQPTPENIKKFFDAAKESNLRAVYEVDSRADLDNLRKSLPPSYWQNITFPVDKETGKPWITGDHFSVYNI